MPYQLSPLVKPRLYALSLSVTLGEMLFQFTLRAPCLFKRFFQNLKFLKHV